MDFTPWPAPSLLKAIYDGRRDPVFTEVRYTCEFAETTAEADERLKAFIGSQRVAAQRPEDVSEQRMAIDSLHTEMIHLQEEKNLVAMQVCSDSSI